MKKIAVYKRTTFFECSKFDCKYGPDAVITGIVQTFKDGEEKEIETPMCLKCNGFLFEKNNVLEKIDEIQLFDLRE